MSMWVILTIVSVALGFLLFTIAFAMFSYGKSKKLILTLMLLAFLLVTVIPLYVAIWQAAYI
ncbi:MAG: hypothetical protein SPK00_04390 [Corynebacterium glucuronolyticum]|nr:hypothetical protein [Corynebacterium glucuronolyticum]MDD7585394.1 hypothetical protein [Mycobacteriaceae bacterium]MDY5833973.1 hypothetical protein [Corynebacterium glucuronolyticum]